MAQALDDLAASQVSIWLDDLSRPHSDGQPGPYGKGRRDRRHHHQPDDLRQSYRCGIGLRGPVARSGTPRHGDRRDPSSADRLGRPCGLRYPTPGLRANRRPRWTRIHRGRSTHLRRHRPHRGRGARTLVAGRQANLFIEIPATLAGLPAITASLADGISVNVTLIFSLNRYRAVLDAFLTGMEQRKAAGGSVVGIESVASFFISRVDTEVDRRLGQMTAQASDKDLAAELDRLRGQAALANARLAYEIYEQMLLSDRWKALAAAGARPQRLLWASTGVKDKTFSDTRYVTDLVAPDTVNTMPEATLLASPTTAKSWVMPFVGATPQHAPFSRR